MNLKSFLKLIIYLLLAVCLASCAGISSTPMPLPTATVTILPAETLTPLPTETPTPEPPLHTIDEGINVLDHNPTFEELTALDQEVQAKNPTLDNERNCFSWSGNAINAYYDKYPFYYTNFFPEGMQLGAMLDTPDQIVVNFIGFNGFYLSEPVSFNLGFSDALLSEHNLTPEKLLEILSDARGHNVMVTIAIAPDAAFTPETKLTTEEINTLKQQYSDELALANKRTIDAISSIDGSPIKIDALKMFLRYSQDVASNPNWTDEKMSEYIEKINGTIAPVVDMTWTE